MTYQNLKSKFLETFFAASIVAFVFTILFISTLRIKSFTELQQVLSIPAAQLVVASNGGK